MKYEIGEYPDSETVSQCCAEPMYSQSDICPACKEHTGTMIMRDEEK